MAINLQRGLFRAWLVVSVLWIALTLFVTHDKAELYSLRRDVLLAPAPPCKVGLTCDVKDRDWDKLKKSGLLKKGDMAHEHSDGSWALYREELNWRGWGTAGGLIFGPPIGILIFGFLIGWVLIGFRDKQ